MSRDPSRKKPLRDANGKIELDDDLIELASMLAEYRLDATWESWFVLPWRSGWAAIRLALDFDRLHVTTLQSLEAEAKHKEIRSTLESWLEKGFESREGYWQASDFKESRPALALSTALRCYLLMVSKSHGGGHVYNEVLRLLYFKQLLLHGDHDLVLDARCHDAIGVGVQLENDRFDRQRRAFKIAWDRGLYNAAYAVPPVKR